MTSHGIQPVNSLSTPALLRVMRGASIGRVEALADAQAFDAKIQQCIDELAARVKRSGLTTEPQPEPARAEAEQALADGGTDASAAAPTPTKNYQPGQVAAIIRAGLASGTGLTAIANELNDAGLTTQRGKPWTYAAVHARVAKMKEQTV